MDDDECCERRSEWRRRSLKWIPGRLTHHHNNVSHYRSQFVGCDRLGPGQRYSNRSWFCHWTMGTGSNLAFHGRSRCSSSEWKRVVLAFVCKREQSLSMESCDKPIYPRTDGFV